MLFDHHVLLFAPLNPSIICKPSNISSYNQATIALLFSKFGRQLGFHILYYRNTYSTLKEHEEQYQEPQKFIELPVEEWTYQRAVRQSL